MLFGGAVVVFVLGFHVILADEPKCLSRFDYDEKMLLKLLRIEDKLEHIEQFIDNMKSVDPEKLKTTVEQIGIEVKVLQKHMATAAEHSNKTEPLLIDFQNNISMINASMGLIQTQIKGLTSPTVAFLVKNPAFESDKLVFRSELLNEGKAFTPKTENGRVSSAAHTSSLRKDDHFIECSPSSDGDLLNVTSETYNISDSVICTCSCYTVMQALREEKLRLQIGVLKKQLGEE
ncbi:uncharacterized protein LOC128241210 [Mya arenaria]|uniref:uncharacterized protein LOC128241210 n=1 Tax=Mya arenaria TaxID=6604 RepID=UPI0022E3E7BE|nr:uncharacterized protein LOC128241210 [Mya arenaria]